MAGALNTIRVAGAIIIKDRKVLATQRSYGDYAGYWEFPGGKIEDGEQPEQALIRELREELDAEVSIDKLFMIVEHDYPKFHMSMRCYLCSLATGGFTLLEHRDARWLSREDIHTVRWLAADFPVIDELIRQDVI